MSTQTSVWVMIATDGVSDKIRDLVDSGYFAEAKDLDYHVKSISGKVGSLISEQGGSVRLSIYDRQVLEMPVTVAEELPLIIAGYREVFGSLMCVGMGLTMREASAAALKATYTNEIEMYDPKDQSYQNLNKVLSLEAEVFQPQPNLYDETHPPSPSPGSDKDKYSVGRATPPLTPQQQIEAEGQMLQATIQQLMGPTQQVQQQAAQQQPQKGSQPESLLEAFSGEKKTDKPKTESKQKKDDDSDDSGEESEPRDDGEDSDSDDSSQKLGDLLSRVQDKMPELMKLHEKNPEAFKKVINLVHKLVDMAKTKKVKKSEVSDFTEELNKSLQKYPVGTVKNRKKKVIVNGRAQWRSVAAGQVRDLKGNPISVDSHNAHAEEGGEEEDK